MLNELSMNLLAALIGALAARIYSYFREVIFNRAIRWFWAPASSSKICLYYGQWKQLLSDFGEIESVINEKDALTLGELRKFLEAYYSEVVIVTEAKSINWLFPVISLGGPLSNPLTKKVGEKSQIPMWFLNLPYSKNSTRMIGSVGEAEVYKSEFDKNGNLVSDIGFVARLRSPENTKQFLYVIAGNYGTGGLGVVRYITTLKKVTELQRILNKAKYFQAIIRCRLLDSRIVDTKIIYHEELD